MLLHMCKDAKTSLHPTIIIVTDVVHDHLGQFLFAGKASAIVAFSFQNSPEALHRAVINTMGDAGHALRHTGLLQLAAIATGVAAGVLSAPNMQPAVIAAVLVLFMFALDIYVWRSAARALKSRMLFLTIPWLSVIYPFRHTLRRIRSRFGRLKKYTWD